MSDDLGTYPGSTRKRAILAEQPAIPGLEEDWDAKPRRYTVGGEVVEFFTIGHLAAALGRSAVTMRKWERTGIIPKATYTAPSDDVRGKRRLYTRAQVEGVVAIAASCALVPHDPSAPVHITSTTFTAQVLDLFKELAQ